jgi:AraC-like DNA-binding protein
MSVGSGSPPVGRSSADRAACTHTNPGAPIDEHSRRQPAGPLRPYVAWYVGYRQRGVAPAVHRGLPSPFLTLIITLDEPLSMLAHPDPGQPPGHFTTLLGGLHSTPALITHDGAQSGIQVALRPLGTRALLGMPAGELADIDVPAESVLGGACAELRERILAAPGWEGRFAVLDEILIRLLGLRPANLAMQPSERPDERPDERPGERQAGLPGVAPEVGWAWRQLLRAGGAVRVSDLASQTGWSSRYLTSRFRTEVGLTPKAAARVIRFSRARTLLARAATGPAATGPAATGPAATGPAATGPAATGPAATTPGTPAANGGDLRLADLAVECGYFDQAHLAREFRSLAGLPPSRWLAEEFRNVQDPRWLSEATWVDQAW